MRFSYKALRTAIKEHVIPYHDAVIEGGIGRNFDRYMYFRDNGFKNKYIGVCLDDDASEKRPGELILLKGDCFDKSFLRSVFEQYQINNPVFVTNGALAESLFNENSFYSSNMGTAVETLTVSFNKQLHIRPASRVQITSHTLDYNRNNGNAEYKRFIKFLDESSKLGWKYEVPGQNVVLMWK